MNFGTDKQKKRLITATIFTFIFMAGYALSMGMIGTLLPRLKEFYGLSVSAASSINIANEIGNTSSMLFALFIVDRLDKNNLLTFFGLCFGAALFLFGLAPIFSILLCIRLLIGFTGGLLDNICATYVSDLYGNERARYVSILHTLFAIGNMLGPQFASVCYNVGGWQLSFLISGIFLAAAAVVFFFLTRFLGKPREALEKKDTGKKTIPYGTILRCKNLWWLAIASTMLAGETYLTMGLPTYLDRLDAAVYTTEYSAMIMTSYSFGMLLSRTGLAALAGRLRTDTYIRWASLIGALIFAGMMFLSSPVVWLVGMFLFGAVSGASYTARFVLSCQEFPLYSSTASAFTGAFAALGNILFNAAVGALADAGHYDMGMSLVYIALIIGFIILTFLYRAPEVTD